MTTKDDCGCTMKDLMPLVGDDVDLVSALFPTLDNEWVTHSVVIPVKVTIRPDGAGIESLIRQYNDLKDVPLTDNSRRDILEHLRDAHYELTHYEDMARDRIIEALSLLQSDTNIWGVSLED